jgi:prolyl-tRNA editing enzyme YbaK/EbsC (Cys-tRNA(Pro) deacylase)
VPLAEAAQRVKELLQSLGSDAEVMEFPSGTRTVSEAATAIGVDEGQIAKSLLFVSGETPVLVVVSGRHRVSMERLEKLTGSSVRKANAKEVRSITGFVIGGVAPIGHAQPLRVILDECLWDYPTVYASAGTPHTVFATSADELLRICQGEAGTVAETINGEI